MNLGITNEAAAQNLSLQDQADELNEQLAMIAKMRPGATAEASASAAQLSQPPAAVGQFSTKAADNIGKKLDTEPILEIKAPAMLAQARGKSEA